MCQWEYTRTGRKHFINDDDYTCYTDGPNWNLWAIVSTCGPFVGPPNRDGYDLYHKGTKIQHAKTVKELKQVATGLMVRDGKGIKVK